MVRHQQQELYILLVLRNRIKHLRYVYTIIEATVCYLLIPQKYINSKHKTLNQNIIHYVNVAFQKILQLITWQIKRTQRNCNFFSVDFNTILSKYLPVFKTSSKRLQRSNFSSFNFLSCKDVLNTSRKTSIHLLKTSWRTENFYSEDVLKTCWTHVLKMNSRRLREKENVYWGYQYLKNLNVYLTNLYFKNLYQTYLRWIQNALIRTK